MRPGNAPGLPRTQAKAWGTRRPHRARERFARARDTRHLVVPSIDILSPFCVRAKFQKIGISLLGRWNTMGDGQVFSLVDDLETLIQQHFEVRVVVPDEEPADSGIELWVRATAGSNSQVAVEMPAGGERSRDQVVSEHAVVADRPDRSSATSRRLRPRRSGSGMRSSRAFMPRTPATPVAARSTQASRAHARPWRR